MQLFLGVDGGQSSTTAYIADGEGRILGRGTGGPCNHITGPEARTRFAGAIRECITEACRQADLNQDTIRFQAAFLGLSGGTEDKEELARELIPADRIQLTHDAEIAHLGALAGAPGVVVISGTGSIAFGRDGDGKVARAGGWGFIYGDEGSAFDLVRQAVRASLKMEEGWGSTTRLRSDLLKATGEVDANRLLHRLYGWDRSAIARLAPLVTAAAEAADQEAVRIVETAAGQLTDYAAGVSETLFGSFCPAASFVGATFLSEALRSEFRVAMKARLSVDVESPRFSPGAGALLGAFSLCGLQVTLTDHSGLPK